MQEVTSMLCKRFRRKRTRVE